MEKHTIIKFVKLPWKRGTTILIYALTTTMSNRRKRESGNPFHDFASTQSELHLSSKNVGNGIKKISLLHRLHKYKLNHDFDWRG